MKEVLVSAITALVVSVIANKILAAYIFKVIDGYVKDIFDLMKELIRNANVNK